VNTNPAPFSCPKTAPSVTLTGARLEFDGVPLFENLDIAVEGGCWTCLLGPSGVGKTSLLRLIAGLTDAAAGAVSCGDGAPIDGRIAYMAQQDLLLPWATVVENVMLGHRLLGERDTGGEAIARAQALIERVGLAGRDADRPTALSGGQRQRVALARTLMEDRTVVLMDEPFSAVDAITRYRLQNLAAELLAGRTVLLVTHDPMEALRLGDVVHVMAGHPARLDRPLRPSGSRPRDPADPMLRDMQADLLRRLAAAEGSS
jgi:putative hydroxymethylpyrimidine transport system ATP-binding protein